jgi:hypothetical protein
MNKEQKLNNIKDQLFKLRVKIWILMCEGNKENIDLNKLLEEEQHLSFKVDILNKEILKDE